MDSGRGVGGIRVIGGLSSVERAVATAGATVGAIWQDKDARLVARACAGDRSAFDALVARHRSYIYGLAYRMCENRDAAEDVCVDAFCEAYRALPRYRHEGKFRVWLHRLALHVCMKHLRQQQARRRYLPQEALGEGVAAEDTYELALTTTSVRQALQALPEPQRMAVSLYYLEERSSAEIAQLLRIPENTVKTRVFRGTQALRELLAAEPLIATPAGGGTHAEM